ncbi:hypothetical protein ACVILH_000612 [Bradyrhizobium sp. USDA 4353]
MDVVAALDERLAGTDGEVVWSWPLDAEVKFAVDAVTARAGDGGKNADPQGEHEGHRKTIARGRPLGGPTCGDCRLLSLLQAGHGPRSAPGLPRALSVFEG